jgi:hypothetical protein
MNKIELIRDDIVINPQKSEEQMKERYNKKVNPLCLTIGDFVYLLKEPIGPGKKFKPKYSGLFVVYKLLLNHMVTVRDPHTGKVFKPVHKDRLKVAYVRELDPID